MSVPASTEVPAFLGERCELFPLKKRLWVAAEAISDLVGDKEVELGDLYCVVLVWPSVSQLL